MKTLKAKGESCMYNHELHPSEMLEFIPSQ